MVNAYYFLEIEVGGVKETVRCDIANVAVDLIIARDFMRRHRAVIEVGGENEPDKLVFRDIEGSASKSKKPRNRSKAHLHAIQQHFHRSVHKDATAPRFPDHPKEREKTTPIPIFRHKNPNGHEDDDDYEPTEDDFKEFTDWVLTRFRRILISDDDELPMPPMRDVQHEIPYIDESDPVRPRHSYKIPDKHLPKWNELREKHTKAGLWIPATSRNVDPMMPRMKKDGKLRPVVDLRRRNANTVKLAMPPVDIEHIRTVLAAQRIHFELDVKGACVPAATHQSQRRLEERFPDHGTNLHYSSSPERRHKLDGNDVLDDDLHDGRPRRQVDHDVRRQHFRIRRHLERSSIPGLRSSHSL